MPAPLPTMWLGAKLLARNPAITVSIHPNESRRASFFEFGALDPTIAVPVHHGKSFGNVLSNSLLHSFQHLSLGDDAIAIGVEAKKMHSSNRAGLNRADRTVIVQIHAVHHRAAMSMSTVVPKDLALLSKCHGYPSAEGRDGNHSASKRSFHFQPHFQLLDPGSSSEIHLFHLLLT